MSPDDFIGTISIYAGIDIPDNWLPCDGRKLPKDQYPELFSIIGYRYGGKDDWFNIPGMTGSKHNTNPTYIIMVRPAGAAPAISP